MIASFIIGALGVYSLMNLDTDISGDGVPNRPQRGPPIEYPWDQAIPILFAVLVSIGLFLLSFIKLLR